jgi:prevent-host-death family protein
MKEVGAYEAKTHLAKLLVAVAQGETIIITKHGEAVAYLVPAAKAHKGELETVVDELKSARKQFKLGPNITLEELKNEGRK